MTRHFDTIIRNGEVVTPTGTLARDVAILNGQIADLLPRGAAASSSEVIDASGLHVLAGAIDIHCHIRAPAFPERGSVESETKAAAAGGITTLFEMPISKPCCNSADQLNMRHAHFAEHAFVDFGLYVAPADLSQSGIASVVDAGAIAFKIFTTVAPKGRDDEFIGLSYPDEADQLAVLEAVAATGLPVVVHCESAQLIAHYEQAGRHLDPALASTHNATRPDVAEAVAVSKLLTMNIQAKARLHIAHVTSAMTVAVLRAFAGTSDFSSETCPHYLSRTVEDVEKAGVFAKINPPVRSKADQDALWAAVADGTIGHVTTDHASFATREKQASVGNFLTAPPGSPGLEMLVPVMLDAVAKGRVSLEQATKVLSANAATRFNLPMKGRIAPGYDADFMLVNLADKTVIKAETLLTHARESAQLYEGAEFSGRVVRTILSGKTIFDAGSITGQAGAGRFVSPTPPALSRAVA